MRSGKPCPLRQPAEFFLCLASEREILKGCGGSNPGCVLLGVVQYLLPFVEKEQYNLSSKCRLSRVNDMFREQEEGKDELRPRQWQCGTCKKIFRTEEDLDRHFDNRHAKTIVGVWHTF